MYIQIYVDVFLCRDIGVNASVFLGLLRACRVGPAGMCAGRLVCGWAGTLAGGTGGQARRTWANSGQTGMWQGWRAADKLTSTWASARAVGSGPHDQMSVGLAVGSLCRPSIEPNMFGGEFLEAGWKVTTN